MSDLGNNESVAAATAPRQVQLTVSGVQNDLKNGLTRPMIQAKYNLSGKDLKDLFSHPSLKGLKTKSAPGFILIDDTVGAIENQVTLEQAIETAEAEQQEQVTQEVEVIEEAEVIEEEEVVAQQPTSPALEPWEQDMSVSDSVL